jgi:hypothetical protein
MLPGRKAISDAGKRVFEEGRVATPQRRRRREPAG